MVQIFPHNFSKAGEKLKFLKSAQKTKQFQDVTTKPTTDEQPHNSQTILFETENFPFEKKIGPGRIPGFEPRTFAVAGKCVTSRLN